MEFWITRGFFCLPAMWGTGKTTLINALLQRLGQDVICTTVPDPGLEKMDFFNYIAAGFGIDKEFQSKGIFLTHFKRFLVQASEAGKKVLLIIDEAQLLTQELLEEIRLLSNIEKSDAKLINIFFVGQNEFNDILNREQNRAVRQRLTLNYNIDPLTPDETADYIKFRLTMAGADHTIFDDGATQEIFIYSGGFPRRINVICDHCLLSGYVQEQKIIDRAIVRECAKELKIPVHVKNRDIDDFAASYEKGSAALSTPPVVSSEKTYGKTREKRPKKKALAAVLVFLLFMTALVAGYLAFPAGYQQAWHTAGDRFISLRHQIREMMPESFAAFISDDTKNNTKTEIPDSVEKQVMANQKKDGFQKPVISEEEIANNLHTRNKSLQVFDISEENSSSAAMSSQEDFLPDTSRHRETLKKQPKSQLSAAVDSKSSTVVETVKEIPPLPEDKVVIRFKYNTNDFTDEGYDELTAFADIIAMHPELDIVVTGYTDSQGNLTYNQKLSEFRANIVGSFLLGKGIKPSQMEIKGLGSENPMETNDTSWGRMMNRRVEIEIKQSDQKE